jgi:hypothetical protein
MKKLLGVVLVRIRKTAATNASDRGQCKADARPWLVPKTLFQNEFLRELAYFGRCGLT